MRTGVEYHARVFGFAPVVLHPPRSRFHYSPELATKAQDSMQIAALF